MLLQQPKSQSTREQNLSSYANHLQQLSAHLDARAHALQASEARLAVSQSDLSTHRHALSQLETRTRHHIAQLLRHIHQRQAALVSWEGTAASTKKSLSRTLAAVDALLSDARSATFNLNNIRAQHDQLQISITKGRAELSEIRAQIEKDTRSHHTLNGTIDTIIKDKQRIQRSVDKLQSLEASLRSREAQLKAREQTISKQNAQLQRLQSLEAILVPLQAFLDSAAAASFVDRVSIDNDMPSAVDKAVVAIHHLQKAAHDAQVTRNEVNDLRQRLAVRESRLKSGESNLRSARQTLEREKAALQLRISDITATKTEISAAWGAIDEARKEADSREEPLREREVALEHAETRVQQRETALSEREKTLARRERSIRRAHGSVAARERAVEAKEREIRTERTRLTDLSKTIELREDMLETRDLELSAREARRDQRLEGLLERSLERRSSLERGRGKISCPVSGGRNTADDSADGAICSQESPSHDSSNEAPSTVRRQLAFFESKDDAEKADNMSTEEHKNEQNFPDDESEAAAEQLLPELVGARSYWRERVERLERIVQSMRNKTWAVKPHVLPVLTSVAEGLLAIRREIDELPRPNSDSSPKNAYLNEQACQIQWREQMKQHFDSVREVQAGLLIRLNREEDAAANSADTSDYQREQSANTSNTAESSVETTLDVTLTGDLTRDILETADQGGLSSSSWRQSQLAAEEPSVGSAVDISSPRWRDITRHIKVANRPLSSARAMLENGIQHRADVIDEADDQSLREDQAQTSPINIDISSEEPSALGENVLHELALLRDDLENVTVSQGSKAS